MASLEGVVIGSAEYVKIVKKAEQEGRVNGLITNIEADVGEIYREEVMLTEKQ